MIRATACTVDDRRQRYGRTELPALRTCPHRSIHLEDVRSPRPGQPPARRR